MSARSSDSHAASRSSAGAAGPAASHSVSSVVLPKPAGAETSVSFDVGAAVQPLAQSRTRHQAAPRPRDIELRLEQRGWHQTISLGQRLMPGL